MSNDLAIVTPAHLAVTFQSVSGNTPLPTPYVVTTALTTGRAGDTRVLNSSALANFTMPTDTVPTNATELATLAAQIAADYYDWCLGQMHVRFAGICNYQPEGLHDIEWFVREGECGTLVRRFPMEYPDVLGQLSSVIITRQCCCDYTQSVTFTGNVSNFVVNPNVGILEVTTTKTVSLSSIVAACQTITIVNVGGNLLLIVNLGGGTNQIKIYNSLTIIVYPGQSITITQVTIGTTVYWIVISVTNNQITSTQTLIRVTNIGNLIGVIPQFNESCNIIGYTPVYDCYTPAIVEPVCAACVSVTTLCVSLTDLEGNSCFNGMVITLVWDPVSGSYVGIAPNCVGLQVLVSLVCSCDEWFLSIFCGDECERASLGWFDCEPFYGLTTFTFLGPCGPAVVAAVVNDCTPMSGSSSSSSSSGGGGNPPISVNCCECEEMPQSFLLDISGITNGSCTSCATDFNGMFILKYAPGSTYGSGSDCTWQTDEKGSLCNGGDPNTPLYVLTCIGTEWELSANTQGGSEGAWFIASDQFQCLANNVFGNFTGGGFCTNHPATVTLIPIF